MGQVTSKWALRASVTVAASQEHAFRFLTERMADWWVREFTWSGPEGLDTIGIEPRLGGKAYEVGPDGFRIDWGRVVAWEPPQRLVLSWHIGPDRVPQPDPARASEVEVRFESEGELVRVDLEHRFFERHGEHGEGYCKAMTTGWNDLLSRYSAALTRVPSQDGATTNQLGPPPPRR